MFTKANNLLSLTITRNGIARQIEAARICALWKIAVKEKFSEQASKKSRAIYFKNKTLTIAVFGSTWAQEFQLRQNEIAEEINRKLGRNIIERIKFEV